MAEGVSSSQRSFLALIVQTLNSPLLRLFKRGVSFRNGRWIELNMGYAYACDWARAEDIPS